MRAAVLPLLIRSTQIGTLARHWMSIQDSRAQELSEIMAEVRPAATIHYQRNTRLSEQAVGH
ncbi:hypothetical protein M378DRAFT_163169 [Amanita muscaria Koide BX008]|uniref:Uncharacterized protein n=1 Tax=Amanita muscaria (strain Koide BX008) TaxID=946122 RepID=A0A0C2TC74_AMAMK|nr:hypothetical protein M378DRAFT_163169 [Amanita muscaria Koide BX008]